MPQALEAVSTAGGKLDSKTGGDLDSKTLFRLVARAGHVCFTTNWNGGREVCIMHHSRMSRDQALSELRKREAAEQAAPKPAKPKPGKKKRGREPAAPVTATVVVSSEHEDPPANKRAAKRKRRTRAVPAVSHATVPKDAAQPLWCDCTECSPSQLNARVCVRVCMRCPRATRLQQPNPRIGSRIGSRRSTASSSGLRTTSSSRLASCPNWGM